MTCFPRRSRATQFWRNTGRLCVGCYLPGHPLFATQTVVGAANRRQPIPYVPELAWATTTSAVATTDSTFTVDTIVRFSGGSWVGDDPLTVKNDPDEYEIATSTRGKIIYCYDDDDEWAWHPLDFPC